MANYNDKRDDLKMNSNMKFLKSLGRNIKNIFVGSHRGEDFILENLEKTDKQSEKAEENPRPEEEIADDWFEKDTYASRHKSTPDHEKSAEEIVTMHEKMYRIATARNNPFHVGGSENAQADIDYIKKHSPWPGGSENFQAK